MKYALTLRIGLIVLPLLIFQNCTKNHLPEPEICYQTDIEPIIVSNCTMSGCHNSTDREAGYDFTSYAGILEAVEPGNYRKSELYTVLLLPFGELRMPQAPADPLPDDKIALIGRWIEEGALQTIDCMTDCDTTSVGYASTVVPILQLWCYGCHAGPAPQGNIDLSSWSAVKPYVDNGRLVGSIRHLPGFVAMPEGGSTLPECQLRQIEKWVADGALNN